MQPVNNIIEIFSHATSIHMISLFYFTLLTQRIFDGNQINSLREQINKVHDKNNKGKKEVLLSIKNGHLVAVFD